MRKRQSRRAFLGATLVAGAASVGYAVVAQEAQPDFELGGRTEGWQGVAPDVLEGEENPTLTLLEGEEYVLVWSNEDGRGHNFAIENENGEDLFATDIITTGNQTVEFTASTEMFEYYCQPHPQSMRGSIEITDDPEAEGVISSEGGEQTQTDEQEDPQENIDEEPTETFELVLTESGWEGQSPEAIQGQTNPTLQLATDEVYEVTAAVERCSATHQTGHGFTVVDEDGQEVAHTDFLDAGQSKSIRFVAEDRIAGYIDERQLAVGGTIEVSGDGDGRDDGQNGQDAGGTQSGDGNGGDDEKSEAREEREEGKGETEDGRDENDDNESDGGS